MLVGVPSLKQAEIQFVAANDRYTEAERVLGEPSGHRDSARREVSR